MFYPKDQYHEFNDVGSYLAFYKHDLMTRYWTATQTSRAGEFCTKGVFPGTSVLAEVTRLDDLVYRVVNGASLGTIAEFLFWEQKHMELEPSSPFWEQWTKHICELVEEMHSLPEAVQRDGVRCNLHFVYNEMFQLFARMISGDEFLRIVGDVEADADFPCPMQFIDLLPLWTVGQAYKVRWSRISQSHRKKEWKKLLSPQISQKFWFEVFDDSDTDDRVGEFHHESYEYYGHLLYVIYVPETSKNEAVAIAEHLIRRLPGAADVYSSIGSKLLRYEDYQPSMKYLQKAEELYLSVMPPDYEGKVCDGNHDYFHFTLLHLGFLHFLNGYNELAKQYFERADAATENWLNFVNVIEHFHDDDPETFKLWYKNELLTYRDLDGSVVQSA